MDDREPTIRSRELGEGLRAGMERAQLSGKEVAKALGWSESRISRMLTGKRGAKEPEVAAFLATCRVIGEEKDRLMALAREQDTKSWFQGFGSTLPMQIRTLVDHENKATAITNFQTFLVPGLLQTGEYARAVISRIANVPAAEIEERLAARAARRILFSREAPPTFRFLIHEFVLRLPVGSSELMSEQLHQLLRMTVRPYITIQVIPAAYGTHAGAAGPFIFLDSPEYRSVVYLEGETSGLFLEKPEEIKAYRNVINGLSLAALDEQASKDLIAKVAMDQYAG